MVSELNAKVIMNWEDSTFGSIGGTRCTVYSNEFNSNLAAVRCIAMNSIQIWQLDFFG